MNLGYSYEWKVFGWVVFILLLVAFVTGYSTQAFPELLPMRVGINIIHVLIVSAVFLTVGNKQLNAVDSKEKKTLLFAALCWLIVLVVLTVLSMLVPFPKNIYEHLAHFILRATVATALYIPTSKTMGILRGRRHLRKQMLIVK